ncbi:LexA family protein [Carboxydothermus hydrogenoformans]|uniref:Putative prophage LambdaCh01, repressor protein n=1 Tax=Carboxydothermus hydrogenoformans (strain ATCC BAA-161 / DSM 6008 / Z-2901) TaxID=246194 RepID=Q3ABG7_CARHZ|nr:LexA family transcriptional regulator [Carboxydothermus hydrogenoformans]ABB14215.1 putative prophage LambdaCh01, repressor protein [Carboxydothermus hydrogenoformans Z-2901]
MNFGQRLRQLRTERDLTQAELAKLLSIGESTISFYESNKRQPDFDTLIKLSNFFNVSIDFLLGRTDESNKFIQNTKTIPLLGTIRAGIPLLAEENWIEEIALPAGIKADFALQVEGESMIYAGIFPGDIAFFKQSETATNGQIVAAGVVEETWKANLKFYVKTNGKAFLRSANPKYKDIEITPQHKIIGIMTGLVRHNPPSMTDYISLVITKDEFENSWIETIETALSLGMSPIHVKQLIEIQATLSKMIKPNE